jgi:hypothetical protein
VCLFLAEFICSWLFLKPFCAVDAKKPPAIQSEVGGQEPGWIIIPFLVATSHPKSSKKTKKNMQVTDIRQLEITYDHLKKMVKIIKIIKMTPHTIGFRSPSHLQASHCSTSTSESHLMGI